MRKLADYLKQGKNFFSRIELKVAIRGGVAAALSWFLGVGFSKFLAHPDSLVSGIWCVLSAFVILQAHLGGTYQAAWVRFLGVLLGSFVGAICTSLLGANPLTLGLSVVLTVCILSLFNLKDSIRIACMSLSVVMILWGLSPSVSPWTFAFFRTIDSTLGILVAVIIAHTLWPSEATQVIRQKMSQVLNLSGKMYRLLMSLGEATEEFAYQSKKIWNEVESLMSETLEFLNESKLELLIKSHSIEQWKNLIDDIERVFNTIQGVQSYRESQLQRIFDEELKSHVNQVVAQTELAFQELSRVLLTNEKSNVMFQTLNATHKLNLDLERFRGTRATRQFDFEEVENYFVFFFNLRHIVEELVVVERTINGLNNNV